MSAYLIYVFTWASIYIMIALAYAIPVGYAGMVNFGHIGLLAVGAYTSAILTTHGVSFWLAFVAAALVTGAVAFFLGLPARNIRGEHFAMMTLGFTFIVGAVILNWLPVTRGPFGISGIERPQGFTSPEAYMVLTLVALVIFAAVVYRIVHSPWCAALEAVRDDQVVAESLGKPVGKLKIQAMVVSGVLVGFAGAFLAHFIQFINVQIFWLDNVVWVISALVVGGLASFRGAIAGMVVLYIIFEAIRFVPMNPNYIGPVRIMIYALLVIVVLLFRPKGIMGRAQLEE